MTLGEQQFGIIVLMLVILITLSVIILFSLRPVVIKEKACVDKVVVLKSYFGEYARIPEKDVKAYLCDEDAVYLDLDCAGCSFWVTRGACAVLTEVCG
jgi:competence protein ComGC